MDSLSTKPKPVSVISAIMRSRRMRAVFFLVGCLLFSYVLLVRISSPSLDLDAEDRLMDESSSPLSGGANKEDPYTALEKRIQNLIDTNHVMVFSKSYCPYSAAAKRLLGSYTSDFKVLEVDLESKAGEIKTILTKITKGHSTFPSIFFDGESIGGQDNLLALDTKHDLKPRLESLGVAMVQ
ncbi:glutaredoxin 3 [Entomortierella parvispora]|uniref:Glutaredoxin 3 n=1 Tax=Entomortierella parvispora TaxID=205924 RepID=A0A9P3LV20_9FUNG|nr:glutaredoxin 3 [Entomortierella parvispora]